MDVAEATKIVSGHTTVAGDKTPEDFANEVDYFKFLFGFTKDEQLATMLELATITIVQWRNRGIPRNQRLLMKLLAEDLDRKRRQVAPEARAYLNAATQVLHTALSAYKDHIPSYEEILPHAVGYVRKNAERFKLKETSHVKRTKLAEGLAAGALKLFETYMTAKTAFQWPPDQIY